MVVAEILANQLATWRANSVDAWGPGTHNVCCNFWAAKSFQTSGDSTRMNKKKVIKSGYIYIWLYKLKIMITNGDASNCNEDIVPVLFADSAVAVVAWKMTSWLMISSGVVIKPTPFYIGDDHKTLRESLLTNKCRLDWTRGCEKCS